METVSDFLAKGGKIKKVLPGVTGATPKGKGTRKSRLETIGKNSPFYTLEQVLNIVPLSRSTVYAMEQSGEFPRKRKISERQVFWVKKEVDEWIEAKINS